LKDLGNTLLSKRPGIGIGDYPAAEHEHISESSITEFGHDPGEEREVRPREKGETHRIGVLLEHRLSDLLWGLVEAGVDDLETVIA
jgi:hypothetical protein